MKSLRKPPHGPIRMAYYPPKAEMGQMLSALRAQGMYYDEDKEYWEDKAKYNKERGRGPPKKSKTKRKPKVTKR